MVNINKIPETSEGRMLVTTLSDEILARAIQSPHQLVLDKVGNDYIGFCAAIAFNEFVINTCTSENGDGHPYISPEDGEYYYMLYHIYTPTPYDTPKENLEHLRVVEQRLVDCGLLKRIKVEERHFMYRLNGIVEEDFTNLMDKENF